MLTEKEVIQIAKIYVKERSEKSRLDLVILEDRCIKKSYGVIFRYNTKKYNDTRNYDDNTLMGNAPFIVQNSNGKIILLGTGREIEYYIQEYEAGRWPDIPRLSDFQ